MRLRLTLFLTALSGANLFAWAAAPAGLHPIVLIDQRGEPEAFNLVLGAFENGRWLSTKAIASRFPKTAQWRVQVLSGQSKLVNSPSPLVIGEEPCLDTGYLALPPTPAPGQYALATSPALNTRPRPVDTLPVNNAAYRGIVQAELVKRGIAKPVVNIVRIARADLDGNGTNEVIISASHYKSAGTDQAQPSMNSTPPHAGAGDYSLLLLRWVRAGQPQTTVLGQSVFTRDERDDTDWQMPTQYDLAGIADLNGDGRMEIVMTDSYYEGSGAAVLEWTPTQGIKERLSEGCGV